MTPTTSAARRRSSASSAYLVALTWLFTLFNSVRVLAYLPTLLAIFNSGPRWPPKLPHLWPLKLLHLAGVN